MSPRTRAVAPHAAHAVVVAALFADVVFAGRLPYFRDVACQFYPNYVFTADALRQGIWPLWNPTADAGAPFFLGYPVELVMLRVLGAAATLALAPPLHVWIAMCGATVLGRRRGLPLTAAWFAGAVYGLSGFVLSSLNLFELSHAAAWMPWVLAALLAVGERATGPRIAALAAAAALLVSTMAGETVMSTAVCAAFLFPWRRARAALPGAAAAAVLCAALAAPVLVGTRAFLEDTRRAQGFSAAESLVWSVPPVVMAEAVLPRFFGDPHTFSSIGYWGQPFFSGGFPYIVSLYLGAPVLLFAWRGRRGQARLLALAAFGLLMAAGAHGPLASPLALAMSHFRAPVKFMLVPTLALALLAGHGAAAEPKGRPWSFWVVGVALIAAAAVAASRPHWAGALAGGLVPELRGPFAIDVIRRFWPPGLALSGLLALAASIALAASGRIGGRSRLWAGACVVVDLAIANGSINLSVPSSAYDLRPSVRALVDRAGPGRWFSYGVAASPGLHWNPRVGQANSDKVLYVLDRQSLWARAKSLDGLAGAFDEDRTAWAPIDSTLDPSENVPARFREHHARLRHAGVRWVLSFLALPEDLVEPRGVARFPEIAEPLTLYELRDALPFAFWAPECAVEPDAARRRARLSDPSFDPRRTVLLSAAPPGGPCRTAPVGAEGRVRWERTDIHTLRLSASGAPGFLVVLEGHAKEWEAESGGTRVPVLRANARYWAIPTVGGPQEIVVRYRPSWPLPALAVSALGAIVALILLFGRRLRLDRSSSAALASAD